MNIEVKSSSGTALVPVETRLFSNRRIFVEGEINHESACDFVKKIMLLTHENTDKPIDVLINSPGGDITAGLLMIDVIQTSKIPIRMFCIGRAYSMGAVLFSCGKHGRYMLPHSELMLHEPLMGNQVGGNASSIKSISERLMETKRMINRILAKHSGKTEEEIEAETSFDHYYSPEESVKSHFADEIVGFDMIMEG